jgi:hypothetical protein
MFPVHLRTGWVDYSPALHWYAGQKVRSVLTGFAPRIRSVSVRIADHEAHDVASRRCTIDVTLKSGVVVSAESTGAALEDLVDRTLESIFAELHQHRRAGEPHRPLSRIA